KQARRLIDQLEAGEELIGVEALTPALHDRLDPLWTYVPRGAGASATRWLLLDPDAIDRAIHDELDIAGSRYQARLDEGKLAFPPGDHYVSRDDLGAALAQVPHRIEARALEVVGTGEPGGAAPALRVVVDDNRALRAELERLRRQSADELMKPLVEAIGAWRRD